MTELLTKPNTADKQAPAEADASRAGDQAAGLLTDRSAAVPAAGASDGAKAYVTDKFGTPTITDATANAATSAGLAGLAGLDAHEVITDARGKETLVPLDKLGPGDHTIELKDGRQFIMHVPPNDGKTELPVMFVIAGSAEGKWNIKDFPTESGMNTQADNPDNKFIVVYPLPKRHLLGTGSTETAYDWNVLDPKGGVLVDKEDSANSGYDDLAFIKKVVDLVPKIANVDTTHKDWAAVGWSQGGVFLNYLASNVPNLFPTMGLVGSALDIKYDYGIKGGNAQNVAIVNLRGDQSTVPFLDNVNAHYMKQELLHAILPKFLFEKLDGLAPVNTLDADPAKQMSLYELLLGKHATQTIDLNTPIGSKKNKDTETVYTSTDPNDSRQVTVFDLPTAMHSYPEPDPSGKRTNATTKYTEFDTNQQIVKLWIKYNRDHKGT